MAGSDFLKTFTQNPPPVGEDSEVITGTDYAGGKRAQDVSVQGIGNRVDTANSTNLNLGIGAVFTGAWVDVSTHTNISIMVNSSHDSATDGLQLQHSVDGVGIDDVDLFTIRANKPKQFTFGVAAKYIRVVYTNGAAAQTTFRMQVILHPFAPKSSSHRIADSIIEDDDAELVKSVITAKRPDDGFINIAATRRNNLGMAVQEFGGNVVDAFGRLRMSMAYALFDSNSTANPANGAKYSDIWTEKTVTTGGTAATTWSNAVHTMTLTKTGVGAVSLLRQTARRFKYYPGKSQAIEMSFYFGTLAAGITQEVGYTDGVNGISIRANGTTVELVERKGGVELVAAQSTWNVDKMDGTGTSGITLDWTKSQIIFMDAQWLGVGRVRYGFVVDGELYYAHQILFTNRFIGVYTNSFHLPLRYFIGAAANVANGTYTLGKICSSVQSEGGVSEEGIPRSISSFLTPKSVANNVRTVVCSIRARDPYCTIKMIGHNLFAAGNTDLIWEWYYNPTLTGATFAATAGLVEIDTAATAFLNGTLLNTGFINAGNTVPSTSQDESTFATPSAQLGQAADGTYTHLTLVATGIGGVGSLNWAINWREII